jgi:hypothetical protein
MGDYNQQRLHTFNGRNAPVVVEEKLDIPSGMS